MTILVTGGAGYIGSHLVRLLHSRGEDVVVVDDLSSGIRDRVANVPLVELDLSAGHAQETLETVIGDHRVDAVIHLAAQKQVGVSMERPTFYYRQNVGGMTNLLAAMESRSVNRLVFSSSAAAYGTLDVEIVTEDMPCKPVNPYGETKLIGEWMAQRASAATQLRATSLRYFNVAGAGWDDLGDPTSFNLIPMVFDRLARGAAPVVFGNDYPTPDGSCIRDYVHVLDLAEAHLAALAWTDTAEAAHEVLNIGTGIGSSVFEVVDAITRVTESSARPEVAARRPGDPARVVADVSRATKTLGWTASHNLADMVSSAWSAYQVTNS